MMNKLMKKIAIALTAATMMVTACTATSFAASCNQPACVTASDFLAIRTSPDVSAPMIAKLNHGEGVVVTDTTDYNGWSKVGYNGQEGYVCSKYLAFYNTGSTNTGKSDSYGFRCDSNVSNKSTYTVSVSSGYLALRNDYSSDSSSEIGQLHNGEQVTVIEGNGKFWLVDAPSVGRVGYVNSNYLV